ncbi:MAG TPA: hypothetical protein VMT62_01035 [Syntrophorhabdaceae bacterium]|nr:hypothetical protein [Syntrophorhabdaceae bacterium]
MKTFMIVLLAAVTIILPSIVLGDESRKWPDVNPIYARETVLHFSYPFETHQMCEILTVNKKIAYLLDCHLGHYFSWEYTYGPDFDCRLRTEQPDTERYKFSDEFPALSYDNLLSTAPKQQGPQDTRGEFLWGLLQPNCARYPEYGRIRHFRLRGMELTLAIKHVEFGLRLKNDPLMDYRTNTITKLDLQVTVKQDPAALSPTAEWTRYAAPPLAHQQTKEGSHDDARDCSKVLVRHEGQP